MEKILKAVEAMEMQGTVVNITIPATELKEFGRYLIDTTREEEKARIKAGVDDILLTVSEALNRLKLKDRTTLYRWEKRGYLIPVRSGNKCLYRTSDIDRVLTSKNGVR